MAWNFNFHILCRCSDNFVLPDIPDLIFALQKAKMSPVYPLYISLFTCVMPANSPLAFAQLFYINSFTEMVHVQVGLFSQGILIYAYGLPVGEDLLNFRAFFSQNI